jgi:hypothetical protein
MNCKSFSFFLFLIGCTIKGIAQPDNLVPNPSFEEFLNGCPEDWQDLPLHWWSWRGSPDVYSTCVVPQSQFDSIGWAPQNWFGFQYPRSGDSYCGFISIPRFPSPNDQLSQREYLGCQLLEPLSIGTEYYVSMFVSAAEGGFLFLPSYANSHLGFYFSTVPYDWISNELETPNFAHVYTTEVITETDDWALISGSFVADLPYTHMAIGLFFESNQIEILQIHPYPYGLGSYYFVDDICVSTSPDCWRTGVIETKSQESSSMVFPNPCDDFFSINPAYGAFSVNVYDNMGRQVLTADLSDLVDSKIKVSQLRAGIYYVEINSPRKNSDKKRERLIILH